MSTCTALIGAARRNAVVVLAIPMFWAASPDSAAAEDPFASSAEPQSAASAAPEPGYTIPALEIIGFDLLLNQFDRHYFRGDDFDTNLSTVHRNLRRGWVVDNDHFQVNQFGHPYQGSIYHGIARSTGHGYWQAAALTFAGSLFWEIAGETTRPSKNDQVASGIAGSFLGEPLFRMARLVREQGGGMSPFWRELAATAISPPTGFNRLVFGERFESAFESHDPLYYSRLQLGASTTTQNQPGTSTRVRREEALADFSMEYGLPGKPGYTYERPFDYFSFQFTASSANVFENIMTRGLLVGREYEGGDALRGIWGLYGSYDYIAPQVFRISSTALSLGSTAQWWLSQAIALQATGMAGVGYAAVSTLHGTGDKDYHYGATPQALLAMRLIFGDQASLDLTARNYYVSGVATHRGHDNIARADASFTWRIRQRHAVTLKYLWSRRDASYAALEDSTQTRATVGIFYTLLGHDRFGAADWR